jgi:hypothetical protein
MDPERASCWLRGNVLSMGKASPTAAESALGSGYGGASGGACSGFCHRGEIGGWSGAGIGGLAGVVAGGLVEPSPTQPLRMSPLWLLMTSKLQKRPRVGYYPARQSTECQARDRRIAKTNLFGSQ